MLTQKNGNLDAIFVTEQNLSRADLLIACPRLLDSGEESGTRNKGGSFFPFYFHVRAFSILSDPTISELGT